MLVFVMRCYDKSDHHSFSFFASISKPLASLRKCSCFFKRSRVAMNVTIENDTPRTRENILTDIV